MPSQTAQRIVFTGKQAVELEEYPVPVPAAGEVLIRTHCSLMSTGTENIVFNRLFDPGTHWDEWVKYPFHPGYASVGEVVSSTVDTLPPGTLVTHRKGHCSHATAAPDEVVRLPSGVTAQDAVWFAMAKIGFHGAKSAQYHLGDSVLVIGAGPIGQMSVRWAVAAGAETVIAADTAVSRLKLAQAGGATLIIGRSIEQARETILQGGGLPRVVIDSTGNEKVFEQALGLAADFGRVVILGDTGRPAAQRLTKDVITRGLTVVGAHDGHNTTEWNLTTITSLFLQLVGQGRFSLAGLNTHRFAPEDCARAYEVANTERDKTMGIVFDWVARAAA